MNHIEALRADLQACWQTYTFGAEAPDYATAPSGRFWLTATPFAAPDTSRELTRVRVYQVGEDAPLFDFWTNSHSCFFDWVTSARAEYLLCAEDLLGGQTVVDLTNRRLAGYSPGADGFIWTDFYLSPDGRTLATTGCYWACPTVIKLFDFSAPLALPLREIREIELLDNDEVVVGWLDNATLKTRGTKRVRDWQVDAQGEYQLVVVSEAAVEREIRLGGC